MLIVALAVIGIGGIVAGYAFRRHDQQPPPHVEAARPRPRPPRWPTRVDRYISERAIDLFEEVADDWWSPTKVGWGRTHEPQEPPYDWQADRPPVVAGSGRGQVI